VELLFQHDSVVRITEESWNAVFEMAIVFRRNILVRATIGAETQALSSRMIFSKPEIGKFVVLSSPETRRVKK